MSNQLFYGSLCYDTIVEQAKKGHPAFSRASNGKVYFNINVWVNSEKDQNKNDGSVQLQLPKDSGLEKCYLGNFKKSEFKEPQPVQEGEIGKEDNDLPY